MGFSHSGHGYTSTFLPVATCPTLFFIPAKGTAADNPNIMIWLLIYNVLIGIALAHFFGKKKKIGFVYGLLFCLFFGFIVGGLIIITSPRKEKKILYKKTTGKQYAGLAICLVLAAGMFYMSYSFQKEIDHQKTTTAYSFNPGLYQSNINGWTQIKWMFISLGIGFILSALYIVDGTAKPKEIPVSASLD